MQVMATALAGRLHIGDRAVGEGNALSGTSKKVVSFSQLTISRPLGRRGAQGARPHAMKTSLPAPCSSSPIWQPVWPLPITSTLPGGSAAGLRYSSASIPSTPGGSVVALSG